MTSRREVVLAAVMAVAPVILTFLVLSLTSTSFTVSTSVSPPGPQLSDAAARQNAFRIFNTVLSALRQWDSSIHHNGMSFMLTTAPAGQPLYHGSRSAHAYQSITGEGFDWLAFEIEHAQCFAQSRGDVAETGEAEEGDQGDDNPAASSRHPLREGRMKRTSGRSLNQDRWKRAAQDTGSQHIFGNGDADASRHPIPPSRGYLHTYRPARALKLLYIDGMAASKSPLGTLDTQDLVLLGPDPDHVHVHGDMKRARGLCALLDDWAAAADPVQLDGFLRMEAGFEVLLCQFRPDGPLERVSVRGSPFTNETAGDHRDMERRLYFEWLRAAAQRYAGFPAGRLGLDWGSMVSLFSYDVDLANPDRSRPDLPRAVGVSDVESRVLRERMRQVALERSGHQGEGIRTGAVDWQGIADLIVSRYAGRLVTLAAASAVASRSLVDVTMDPYLDYLDGGSAAHLVERCTKQFLDPALLQRGVWTPEDRSIYVALETVTGEICSTFAKLRHLLHGTGSVEQDLLAGVVHKEATGLMARLSWAIWRRCGRCPAPDEECLVVMFPWGDREDYFSPKCRSAADLELDHDGSYWE